MENVALYEGLYENMLSTLNSMAKILDARIPYVTTLTRVTNFSLTMAIFSRSRRKTRMFST